MNERFKPLAGEAKPRREVGPTTIVARASQRINELGGIEALRIDKRSHNGNTSYGLSPQLFIIVKHRQAAIPFLHTIEIFNQTEHISRSPSSPKENKVD